MMRPTGEDVKVYLYRRAVDMRRYAQTINMRSAWWRTRISTEAGSFTALHNGKTFQQT
jgi:hypothetical protein